MISYIANIIPYEMANLIVNDIVNTLAKAKAKTIANNNATALATVWPMTRAMFGLATCKPYVPAIEN
jgi:hypothetical protein